MTGTVIALGAVACAATLALGLAVSGAAAVAGQRAAAAADAAALAAADGVSGAGAGDPCERAATVSAAVGATLTACEIVGTVATVRVSLPFGRFAAEAAARAGPAP